jgi:hypothetical protein
MAPAILLVAALLAADAPDPFPDKTCGRRAFDAMPENEYEQQVNNGRTLYDATVNAHVIIDSTTRGACDVSVANQIIDGLKCALGKADTCLGVLNADKAAALKEVMGGGRKAAVISCMDAPLCASLGSTRTVKIPLMARYYYTMMVVNVGRLVTYDKNDVWHQPKTNDEKMCMVMMHEALHWSGYIAVPFLHNLGNDEIHTCSRYCGGMCADANAPTYDEGMKDCLACASSSVEKAACGTAARVLDVAPFIIPPNPPPSCGSKACGQMRVWRMTACDHTDLGLPSIMPPELSWMPGVPGCCENCCDEYPVAVGAYECDSIAPQCALRHALYGYPETDVGPPGLGKPSAGP